MLSNRALGTALALPPIVYMLIFFFTPAGFLFVYSFWSVSGFRIVADASFINYSNSLSSPLFLSVTLNAFVIGITTAAVSLVLSLPIAYYLTYVNRSQIIFYAILITWFASYLVRIYAWRTLLGTNGLLNSMLLQLGIIERPLEALLFSRFAVTVALTQIYLPFCILLVTSALSEIKQDIVDASRDLGAGPIRAFFKVVAPNAANGLVGAFMLTFLLAAGDYVTPQMLGGPTGQTTGMIIADNFRKSGNWPLGAAQAFIMFAIALLLYVALVFAGKMTGVIPRRGRQVKAMEVGQ